MGYTFKVTQKKITYLLLGVITFISLAYLQYTSSIITTKRFYFAKFNESSRCPTQQTHVNGINFEIKANPPGVSSRIYFRGVNVCNKTKNVGGDFWWVMITGPASFSFPLIDNGMGVYFQNFQFPIQGTYIIKFMLEYSDYNALNEPPTDWIKKGDRHGRHQKFEDFGNNNHFVMKEKIVKTEVVANADSVKQQDVTEIQQDWFFQQFCIINPAFGYWIQNKYVTTYVRTEDKARRDKIQLKLVGENKSNASTIWFYGDSLTMRFHEYLSSQPLCLTQFSCLKTYNWLYPLVSGEAYTFTNKDFNETEYLLYISNVLLSDRMRNNSSVLLINFGLHVIKCLRMTEAEKLMDSFIGMIKKLKLTYAAGGFPRIIWKTTTPTYQERSLTEAFLRKSGKYEIERYITKPRVMQWNEYCIKKLCEANIPVLDIFWMAASYPDRTMDATHYKHSVFESAANSMKAYIS